MFQLDKVYNLLTSIDKEASSKGMSNNEYLSLKLGGDIKTGVTILSHEINKMSRSSSSVDDLEKLSKCSKILQFIRNNLEDIDLCTSISETNNTLAYSVRSSYDIGTNTVLTSQEDIYTSSGKKSVHYICLPSGFRLCLPPLCKVFNRTCETATYYLSPFQDIYRRYTFILSENLRVVKGLSESEAEAVMKGD